MKFGLTSSPSSFLLLIIGVSTVVRSGMVGASGSGHASAELACPMKAFDGTSMDVMSSWLRGDISVSVVASVVVESVSGLGGSLLSLFLKLQNLLIWVLNWLLNCCLQACGNLGVSRRPVAPS